jgi:hypothetical protein
MKLHLGKTLQPNFKIDFTDAGSKDGSPKLNINGKSMQELPQE